MNATPDQLQETLLQQRHNAEEFRSLAKSARRDGDPDTAQEYDDAAAFAEKQAEKCCAELTALMMREAG